MYPTLLFSVLQLFLEPGITAAESIETKWPSIRISAIMLGQLSAEMGSQ
jgi:hypothetical protein